MTEDDNAFFQALGHRIAAQSAQHDPGRLAEYLGISQERIASSEKDIRKVPASIVPTLAKLFSISVDELVGLQDTAAKRELIPNTQDATTDRTGRTVTANKTEVCQRDA